MSAFWEQKKKQYQRRRKRAQRRAAGQLKPKTWCRVYAIRSQEGRTVYIGQTRLDIEGRLRWHRKTKDSRICQWMKAEKAAGRSFNVVVLEENGTWDVSEIIWIERARAASEPLLNQTRGGRDPYRGPSITAPAFVWDDDSSWP